MRWGGGGGERPPSPPPPPPITNNWFKIQANIFAGNLGKSSSEYAPLHPREIFRGAEWQGIMIQAKNICAPPPPKMNRSHMLMPLVYCMIFFTDLTNLLSS